ncbi:DUF285 domain-containing protein (plasmid) [Citricoccus nitrophenolicus]
MTRNQTRGRSWLEYVRALWRSQAGYSMTSTIAGVVIGAMLLGALTYAITGTWQSQARIQQTTDKAADVVAMEAAFRQDVTWAANIPSRSATEAGFTAVVPGTGVEGACRVSTWVASSGVVKNVSQTFERARQNPGEYVPGSETGATGCTGAMVAEDERSWDLPGGTVKFAYKDIENTNLVKFNADQFRKSGSTDPIRVGGVQYTPPEGGVVYQPALNLDEYSDGSAAVENSAAAPDLGQPDIPGLMVSIWNPALQRDIYGATHACQPNEYPLVLPLRGDVDVEIDWGDGKADQWTTGAYPYHCYTNGNQRTVTIAGTFTGWGEKDTPMYGIAPSVTAAEQAGWARGKWARIADRSTEDLLRQNTTWSSNALLRVTRWDDPTLTTDLSEAFYGAENLVAVAEIPITTTRLDGALAFTKQNVAGVSGWETPNVTSMRGTFQGATGFNQSLAGWDTADVTDMGSMFNGASAFNSSLSSWNTAKVKDMSQMFSGASVFNTSVAGLDTQSVVSMAQMFRDAVKFNQPVDALKTAKVTDMTGMFHGALVFNRPITHANWDTSKVTSMAHMFEHARAFNSEVTGLDTQAAVSMNDMFHFARAFNKPVNQFETISATTMARMFMEARVFNQPLNLWDTVNVTDFSGMFSYAKAFQQFIEQWDTDSAVTMSAMFHEADTFNRPLTTWNVRKVKDFSGMFSMTDSFNQLIAAWSIDSAVDLSYMFNGAQAYNQSVNLWGAHMGKVKYTHWMFANAPIYNQPMDMWKTGSVVKMGSMFMNADGFNQNLAWDVTNVLEFNSMFANAEAFNGNIRAWNTAKAERADGMFNAATAFNQDLSSWNLNKTDGMNAGFASGAKIDGQPERWPCAVRWQTGTTC